MTPELQKYYEDRFSMMATPGWRDLIDDIEKIKLADRKSTRLNPVTLESRMPSSA